MKPSFPLYYNAADVLAAFSHPCEPALARPAERVVTDRRASLAGRLSAAMAGSTAAASRLLQARSRAPARDAVVAAPTPLRDTMAERAARRPVELGSVPRYPAGLRSHFALIAPAE